jgi:hypothetical protein
VSERNLILIGVVAVVAYFLFLRKPKGAYGAGAGGAVPQSPNGPAVGGGYPQPYPQNPVPQQPTNNDAAAWGFAGQAVGAVGSFLGSLFGGKGNGTGTTPPLGGSSDVTDDYGTDLSDYDPNAG